MANTQRRGTISGNKRDGYNFALDIAGSGPNRKRVRRRGFATKTEAQEALNLLLAEQTQGTFVAPTDETVGGFLTRWLDEVEPTLAPSTFDSYVKKIGQHAVPRLGTIKLQDLDGLTLNAFYADLLTDGRKDGGGGLAPRTVHYISTIVGRAMKDAVRWGLLNRNPCALSDPPRGRSTRKAPTVTWSTNDLGAFFDHCDGDRYLPLYRLLATTGMRRGEALGLRWADIDFSAGTASIVQTLICVDHKRVISTAKTDAGQRQVDLDDRTLEMLADLKRTQASEFLALGIGKQEHDLVFTQPDGSWTHPERVTRRFQNRVREMDGAVPQIRLHDLRHTWATLAMKAGVPAKVVQERLGHARVSITLDIYSHVMPGMQREAAELVAGAIDA